MEMIYRPFLDSLATSAIIETARPLLVDDFRKTRAEGRTGARLLVDTPELLAIREHAAAVAGGVPLDFVEPVEVVRYVAGSSYPLHSDLPWRSTTVLVYLNVDYTGGRTVFPNSPAGAIEPKAGWALSWPNASAPGIEIPWMRHLVEPVISGEKWVAVCWVQWGRVDRTAKSGEPPRQIA